MQTSGIFPCGDWCGYDYLSDLAVVVLVVGGSAQFSLWRNLAFKEMSETGGAVVKIVVVKSPKVLRGILRKIFGIK